MGRSRLIGSLSMVCTLGGERMGAMVRLLTNGHFPEITLEEASHDKLAAQSIHRVMVEADEANLLAEEDMHVFDSKPMTDTLHLVCCNACKKPVKASQYASHAERCKLFPSTEENFLEHDGGGTGHKKPPRKGRKRLQTAQENQSTTVGDQERSGSIDRDDSAASESNVDDLTGMTPFYREAKRNSASINGAVRNGSRVSPRSTNYKAAVVSSSEKRAKLIVAERPRISEGLETGCGATTNTVITCQDALTCNEFPSGSIAGREKPCDSVGGCQKPGQVSEHGLSSIGYHRNDSPAPLATKIYYVQRNHRLRSALSHLYHESLSKEDSCNALPPQQMQGNAVPQPKVSSPRNLVSESQVDDMLQEKKDAHNSPAVRIPDQILAQSSELCLGNAGGYQSALSFSNQFRDNNFSRPVLSVDTAPMGMMRSRYLPTTYSFSGNAGTSLGTMQQPSGSVPVI